MRMELDCQRSQLNRPVGEIPKEVELEFMSMKKNFDERLGSVRKVLPAKIVSHPARVISSSSYLFDEI